MSKKNDNFDKYINIPKFNFKNEPLFYDKVKNAIFNLYFLLLKDLNTNFWYEAISIIIEYIQLYCFPIGGTVKFI